MNTPLSILLEQAKLPYRTARLAEAMHAVAELYGEGTKSEVTITTDTITPNAVTIEGKRFKCRFY